MKQHFCLFVLSLIEEGGDWDRRNRLKVYQGLYCVAIRDFKQAAELFLDTVSTFTSYELMDYKTFVTYTVYVSMIALDRPDLREKVGKADDSPDSNRSRFLRLFTSCLRLVVFKPSVSITFRSLKGQRFWKCYIVYQQYDSTSSPSMNVVTQSSSSR